MVKAKHVMITIVLLASFLGSLKSFAGDIFTVTWSELDFIGTNYALFMEVTLKDPKKLGSIDVNLVNPEGSDISGEIGSRDEDSGTFNFSSNEFIKNAGIYTFIVTATDDGSSETLELSLEDSDFFTETPIIINPANGSSVIDTAPELSWEPFDTPEMSSSETITYYGEIWAGDFEEQIWVFDDVEDTSVEYNFDGTAEEGFKELPLGRYNVFFQAYIERLKENVDFAAVSVAAESDFTVSNLDDVLPEAEFKAEPLIGIAPLQVQFTDTSRNNPTSWIWEFGDDTNSSRQNPIHIYQEGGLYTVKLTVSNSFGKDFIEKEDFIEVKKGNELVADFTVDKSTGFVPLTVNFIDTSKGDPTSWVWEFGDGGTSDEQNPVHEYLVSGKYTVSLTVSRSGSGSDEKIKANFINVIERNPVAAFKASSTVGKAPVNVTFSDLSQPVGDITSWLWDFGDGEDSTEQNPVHEYNLEGFYTVSLTVSNESGADSEIKTNLIAVKGQNIPISDFTTDKTKGQGPLTVQFFDKSEPDGDITSWIWDFGDGTGSEEQHPSHVYEQEGVFTVTLTAGNAFGASSEVKTNLIAVAGANDDPLAAFSANNNVGVLPVSIEFKNDSGGNILSSLWEFGDGGISTESDPVHIYSDKGEFDVSLSIGSVASADTLKNEKFIKVIDKDDVAAWFSANQLTGRGSLEVQFVDRAVGDVTGWLWDFGDGETSTEQNPKHFYVEPGKFTVSLAVSGKSGRSHVIKREAMVEVLGSSGILPGIVKGMVTDEKSGEAIFGATVNLRQSSKIIASVTTTNDGLYFLQVMPGNYTLSAIKEKFSEFTKSVSVSSPDVEIINIVLKPLESPDGGDDDDNDVSGKSFTFNCEHSMKRGPLFGLEKLTMNVGDTENCTLRLINNETGKTVEISTLLKKGFRQAIEIEPARSVTDENGEIEITITAIRKGKDWAAWAVPNDRGLFKFNKKTYDTGLAWGMFVEVK